VLKVSFHIEHSVSKFVHTVESGYNDIGLGDTSSIASDILLTVTLFSSVTTTPVYNDTKYSFPFMTL
jgi:hypothetical protein